MGRTSPCLSALLVCACLIVSGCSITPLGGASIIAPIPSGPQKSPLVVFTYGHGNPGSGSGQGLRDVADEIRRRDPASHVITRGCDDDDSIASIVNNYRGPVVLIGHSYGGDETVKLARRVHRSIEGVVLLDPVARGAWGFPPGGQHFRIPESVQRAICFYRPGSDWPVSYPIINPTVSYENRPRRIGHNAFCSNSEVRRCILEMASAQVEQVALSAR